MSVPTCSGSGTDSFVGGGSGNVAAGGDAFVGGGSGNENCDSFSVIVGGEDNTASATSTAGAEFIGAGEENVLTGADFGAAIVAGFENTVTGPYSAIVAGDTNTIGTSASLIGTGLNNSVTGTGSDAAIVSGPTTIFLDNMASSARDEQHRVGRGRLHRRGRLQQPQR